MTYSAPPLRIRWGFSAICAAALLAAVISLSLALATAGVATTQAEGRPADMPAGASPVLVKLAAERPAARVEAIVQFEAGLEPAAARDLVTAVGGRVTGDLHVINGLAARMSAEQAHRLASHAGVQAVSLNASTKPQSITANKLATTYNQSLEADKMWSKKATGAGVGVAVIDTGIAGGLRDFSVSQQDTQSRVIASAVTNPDAKTATDTYGHGTHVAGIIAGNGTYRSNSDRLRDKYVGVAPNANLISIKVSDDDGEATVLDVIYGLQFAVDFRRDYNIRVVNLSLESSAAESYKTDPLDAAVEAAWFSGIVVVAAAGNRGSNSDAVHYAPANDPFVISVGAIDDVGTKNPKDDKLESWSSRGQTQDGFAKPEVVAPGSHIVSLLSPDSAFASMCPSCIVSNEYIRAGGTSMAAPMIAGLVANLLEVRPGLTPDQVKSILMDTARTVGAGDVATGAASLKQKKTDNPNAGIEPNVAVDPATGAIDYTRSRWSRSRWSTAPSSLGAAWARSRWSCTCFESSSDEMDPARSRWSRSRWSRSRWSMSWTK